MMPKLRHLFVEHWSQYDCPPLGKEALAEAVQALGYHLPTSYLRLLQIRNGGFVNYNRVVSPEGDELPQLCGFIGIGGEFSYLASSPYLAGQWGLPKESVMFDFVGHGGYLFDYRFHAEPRILHVNSERYPLVESVEVARNFRQFLGMLRLPVDQQV